MTVDNHASINPAKCRPVHHSLGMELLSEAYEIMSTNDPGQSILPRLKLYLDSQATDPELGSRVTDAMGLAGVKFMEKTSYLDHPEVRYRGIAYGDSQEAWQIRLFKRLYETMRAAGGR